MTSDCEPCGITTAAVVAELVGNISLREEDIEGHDTYLSLVPIIPLIHNAKDKSVAQTNADLFVSGGLVERLLPVFQNPKHDKVLAAVSNLLNVFITSGHADRVAKAGFLERLPKLQAEALADYARVAFVRVLSVSCLTDQKNEYTHLLIERVIPIFKRVFEMHCGALRGDMLRAAEAVTKRVDASDAKAVDVLVKAGVLEMAMTALWSESDSTFLRSAGRILVQCSFVVEHRQTILDQGFIRASFRLFESPDDQVRGFLLHIIANLIPTGTLAQRMELWNSGLIDKAGHIASSINDVEPLVYLKAVLVLAMAVSADPTAPQVRELIKCGLINTLAVALEAIYLYKPCMNAHGDQYIASVLQAISCVLQRNEALLNELSRTQGFQIILALAHGHLRVPREVHQADKIPVAVAEIIKMYPKQTLEDKSIRRPLTKFSSSARARSPIDDQLSRKAIAAARAAQAEVAACFQSTGSVLQLIQASSTFEAEAKSAVAYSPISAEARFLLATALYNKRDYEAALSEVEIALLYSRTITQAMRDLRSNCRKFSPLKLAAESKAVATKKKTKKRERHLRLHHSPGDSKASLAAAADSDDPMIQLMRAQRAIEHEAALRRNEELLGIKIVGKCARSGCIRLSRRIREDVDRIEVKCLDKQHCRPGCFIQYHADCWRAVRKTLEDSKLHFGSPCVTPNCDGTIVALTHWSSDKKRHDLVRAPAATPSVAVASAAEEVVAVVADPPVAEPTKEEEVTEEGEEALQEAAEDKMKREEEATRLLEEQLRTRKVVELKKVWSSGASGAGAAAEKKMSQKKPSKAISLDVFNAILAAESKFSAARAVHLNKVEEEEEEYPDYIKFCAEVAAKEEVAAFGPD